MQIEKNKGSIYGAYDQQVFRYPDMTVGA